MAPVSQADHHDVVESNSPASKPDSENQADNHSGQLKNVIQDLYQLMIQVNAYDLAGRPTRDVLESSV
jgi:mediator of RNA polymerase II transcription subunit 10